MLLVATVPVALVFLGGQWLLTIPIGPIWPMDLVLLTAYVLFLTRARSGIAKTLLQRPFWALLCLLLPAWASIRLSFSGISLESLREFHPFLVLSYAVVVWLVFVDLNAKRKGWLYWSIAIALLVHAAAVLIRRTVPSLSDGLTVGSTAVGISGPHVDGLFLASLAGVLTHGWMARPEIRRAYLPVVLAVVSWLSLSGGNRAGYVALIIGCLTVGCLMVLRRRLLPGSSIKTMVALPLTMLAVVAPVSILGEEYSSELVGGFSYVEERYSAFTEETVSEPPDGQENVAVLDQQLDGQENVAVLDQRLDGPPGSGTVRARLNAWTNLVLWTWQDPSRAFVGVGFGANYLYSSGSAELLRAGADENDGNKWPHNHLLTIFASLGLPALAVFLVLCVVAFFLLCQAFLRTGLPIYAMATSILVATSVASLFGVIFENPWGSIPIAWSIGVAFASRDANKERGLPSFRHAPQG